MMPATTGGHDIGHVPTTTQTIGVADLMTHKTCLFFFSVAEFPCGKEYHLSPTLSSFFAIGKN
jgi:hypothetical protein